MDVRAIREMQSHHLCGLVWPHSLLKATVERQFVDRSEHSAKALAQMETYLDEELERRRGD